MLQDILSLLGVGAHVGRNVGQNDVLTEIKLDHLWYVSIDGLIVSNSCARRVDQCYPAVAIHIHQSADADRRVGPQGARVEEVIVDAAVDHIDPFESPGRSHPDITVVDDQIRALDQLDSHLLG